MEKRKSRDEQAQDINQNSNTNINAVAVNENQPSPSAKEITPEIEQTLLDLVMQFLSEFKGDRVKYVLKLDASIERELGIDSLGRVELFLRIATTFQVSLPDDVLYEAETLRDIAYVIEYFAKEPQKFKFKALEAPQNQRQIAKEKIAHKATIDPLQANTLIDILMQRTEADPDRPHIYLQESDDQEYIIRYGELLHSAKQVAIGLQEKGIQPSDTIAIMLPTGREFFYAFFGILLAGGIPVPIYPPTRPDKIEEYALREAAILNNAEVRILITFAKVEVLSHLLRHFIQSLSHVVTVSQLMQSTQTHLKHVAIKAESPALIQYTSGSTSQPKGVLLSHANLLSNIRTMHQSLNLVPTDVTVSWLPLYHDMGLIGSWLTSVCCGYPVNIMSPLSFLTRPERWLWAIHYRCATLSAAPNFAYELCVQKIPESAIEGLDLSSWRLALNGAEPINAKTIERFIDKFAPYGFAAESFYPVYGLAENSLALTFPPLGRKPLIDIIDRDRLINERKAVAVSEGNAHSTLQIVSCGKPLQDHHIRIVDEQNKPLPERTLGNIQFSGPSAMLGYYRQPEATQNAHCMGFWNTGDLGYLAEGELYITGRKKDLIIKAGRNLHPQEIEEVANQIDGLRKGCTIAFGVEDPRLGTERLVVVSEIRPDKAKIKKEKEMIEKALIEKISIVIGMPPDEIVLVPPHTIPKTSSGKLQRSACKNLYLSQKLGKSKQPIWLQMAKIALRSLLYKSGKALKKIGQVIYTVYVALMALITVPPSWATLLILPANAGSSIAKLWCKYYLKLCFVKVTLEGSEHLTKYPSMIFVCNHTSFADSVILCSILPTNNLFTGKSAILKWPVVGSIFKNLGFLTLDHRILTQNLKETQHISKILKDTEQLEKILNEKQHSLLLYPEATLSHAAGLRPFKLGAFKLAVDTQTPICTIGIQGARQLLRRNSFLFKPAHIRVTVGGVFCPQGTDWNEVMRLHNEVRHQMASDSGEMLLNLIAATSAQKQQET